MATVGLHLVSTKENVNDTKCDTDEQHVMTFAERGRCAGFIGDEFTQCPFLHVTLLQ